MPSTVGDRGRRKARFSRKAWGEIEFYPQSLRKTRSREYACMNGATYLDHGGATIVAKSVLERFSQDLSTSLYGNPHSSSPSSVRSTLLVDAVRERLLRFFNADPKYYDLVFTANATAAIKLVVEAFADHGAGYDYAYHVDSHTSLVAVSAKAEGARCFESIEELKDWIGSDVHKKDEEGSEPQLVSKKVNLIGFPAQSNLNGYRPPYHAWTRYIKTHSNKPTFVLLDAAAFTMTGQLELNVDIDSCPDLVSVSLYKIFGFPDMGALLIKKPAFMTELSGKGQAQDRSRLSDSEEVPPSKGPSSTCSTIKSNPEPLPGLFSIFYSRKFFGGGTVDMVVSSSIINTPGLHSENFWVAKNTATFHDMLEDGTLPFHNILALNHAMTVHEELYGRKPMGQISKHTANLSRILYTRLDTLFDRDSNLQIKMYKSPSSTYGDPSTQGPTLSFNLFLRRPHRASATNPKDGTPLHPIPIPKTKLEHLAVHSPARIHLRTGGVCNPGGISTHCDFSPADMRRNFDEGVRCGNELDIVDGKPTGVVRVSLGAMTTRDEVERFVEFVRGVDGELEFLLGKEEVEKEMRG